MRNADGTAYVGVAAVGVDREPHVDVASLPEQFQRTILWPLMAAVMSDPEGVRMAAAELRGMLEKLDDLVAVADEPGEPANGTGSRAAERSVLALVRANGGASHNSSPTAEIGRNQRAQVREMLLLELLSEQARAYTISQLMAGLEARGFADGQPAVVSQLHRMKGAETIRQPNTGLYEITAGGIAHLQRLRSTVGPLLRR